MRDRHAEAGPGRLFLVLAGTLLLLSASVIHVSAFTNGQTASIVIPINSPGNLAFDSLGNLWVGGIQTSTITEFRLPFSSGSTPSFMLFGSSTQGSDLISAGVTFDSSGNLWVPTGGQGRILEFSPPFSSNMNASLVIGQPDFKTIYRGPPPPPTDHTMDAVAIAFDSSGNIWVVDGGGGTGNRILEFKPPFNNGMSASLVIGQTTFGSNTAVVSKSGLGCSPFCGLAFDQAGDLWVVSQAQNRVLEYMPPFSSGMDASLVIGQPGFTSSSPSVSLTGLTNPLGIAFDAGGNLWVDNSAPNIILLEYKPPFANGMSASMVLGQDITGGGWLAFDSSGNLWASDQPRNRVVEFLSSVTTITSTTSASLTTAVTSSSNSPTASATLNPGSTTSTNTTSPVSIVHTIVSTPSVSGSSTTASSASNSLTSQAGGLPDYTLYIAAGSVVAIIVATSVFVLRKRR